MQNGKNGVVSDVLNGVLSLTCRPTTTTTAVHHHHH